MATHESTRQYSYPLDASMTFKEAAEKWFDRHKRDLKPNTVRSYKCALARLVPFFGEMILKEIHLSNLYDFQDWRLPTTGPQRINSELSTFGMILKQAGQWDRVWQFYKPLRVPLRRAGHSLSAEDEQRLRVVAFSKTKWILAAHCMTVMLSTTMGFGELSSLRRRDVDMNRKSVRVGEGAKNEYRVRTIPLNGFAMESMEWLLDRWKDLGGNSDDQYILPHRPRVNKGPWLFYEPQTAIRTAFRSIRKEAGLPHFRVYDCRVQAITKLLSNPAVSPQVSKEIAGHISQDMQDRYSIQQFSTKMAAVQAMDGITPVPPEPVVFAAQSPHVAPAEPAAMHPAIHAEIVRQAKKEVRAQKGITRRQPTVVGTRKSMEPTMQTEIARQVAKAVDELQGMWEPIPTPARRKRRRLQLVKRTGTR